MDADRNQTHQRRAAGDRDREGGAADPRACGQMGRAPRRAHGIGRAGNDCIFVGMSVALGATDGFFENARRFRGNGSLPMSTDLSNETDAPIRYAYKASLIGSAHQFELTDYGLSWQVGG